MPWFRCGSLELHTFLSFSSAKVAHSGIGGPKKDLSLYLIPILSLPSYKVVRVNIVGLARQEERPCFHEVVPSPIQGNVCCNARSSAILRF